MPIRIADPLIGLSSIGDLGRGLPVGQAGRTCFIACRLARTVGADDSVVRDVFYTALMQHVGCVAHAHDSMPLDQGRTVEVNAAVDRTDFSRPTDVFRTLLAEVSQGAGVVGRARLLIPAARMGPVFLRTSCEVAEATTRRIGLPPSVQVAVRHVSEWFNGKGGYLHRRGDEIPLAARVVQVAFAASVFDTIAGPDETMEVVRSRAGRSLDPTVAAGFVRDGRTILAELAVTDVLKALPAEEPEPKVCVPDEGRDEIAIAFGELVDLKAPFTHGAARRAFELAAAAATSLGLDAASVGTARRAAALRDIGKAAIPNAIIEKPAALTEAEWEPVRLHAYHSERVLSRSPALAVEAQLASLHHEAEDGSGYHRGASGPSLSMAARVVAATDALVAMTQPRPYRAALELEPACAQLHAAARAGRLSGDAVAAVVAAAGGVGAPARPVAPAGLSERQVEVLRLVARGLSNRQIAERLVVSPRTAEHHVQDIYLKIGVASRAAAALFAVEHHLL